MTRGSGVNVDRVLNDARINCPRRHGRRSDPTKDLARGANGDETEIQTLTRGEVNPGSGRGGFQSSVTGGDPSPVDAFIVGPVAFNQLVGTGVLPSGSERSGGISESASRGLVVRPSAALFASHEASLDKEFHMV